MKIAKEMRSGRMLPTDEGLELIAARFRVLGEPSRLKLIRALMGGEMSVGQLTEATLLTQANTSRHLQTLTEAGILGRRKDGLSVIYFIADPGILDLCEHVCGVVQRRHANHAETLRTGSGIRAVTEGGPVSAPGSSSAGAKAEPELTGSDIAEAGSSAEGAFMVSFD